MARSERCDRLGDPAWIVAHLAERISDNVADRRRVLSIDQQINNDARGTGDRKAAQGDPLVVVNVASVHPDIGSATLPSNRQGELMDPRRQMTESIQRGGRPVRNDSRLRSSFPGRGRGVELQPRGPQIQVVGLRHTGQPVDAMGYPLGGAVGDHSGERAPRHAGAFGLAAGEKAPLFFGEVTKSTQSGGSRHELHRIANPLHFEVSRESRSEQGLVGVRLGRPVGNVRRCERGGGGGEPYGRGRAGRGQSVVTSMMTETCS